MRTWLLFTQIVRKVFMCVYIYADIWMVKKKLTLILDGDLLDEVKKIAPSGAGA